MTSVPFMIAVSAIIFTIVLSVLPEFKEKNK
jgi:hypothetical protein